MIFNLLFAPLNILGIRPQKWFGDLKMISSISSSMIMCCFLLIVLTKMKALAS